MNEFLPFFHWTNLLIIPGVLVGYAIHELGHTFAAYFLGDDSQVERGKFTLNPFRHISWFGTAAFMLFGIGWANPMQVNAQPFRDRPLALGGIAFAGIFASFTFSLTALLFTLLLATLVVYNSGATTESILPLLFPLNPEAMPNQFNLQALTMAFTSYLAIASFWLGFTSLLPLPTMDGFVVVLSLYTYLKQDPQQPRPKQQAVPAPPPPSKPRFIPVNQYERRNNVADIHFKAGTEYHQENKYDDAIARYRQAIATDQHFGPAYVNLGLAYLGKGRRREAIHAFRGAVQFADDQKSQQEAWYQLHQLSEVSPVDEDAEANMTKMGASPWTDTRPRPDWFGLGLSAALLLVGSLALYSYLFSGLVRMLQT